MSTPNDSTTAAVPSLDRMNAIISLERKLTTALDKIEPWLTNTPTPSIISSRSRVRPLPTSLQEAEQVLALARNLANRTSAPAGWSPNAPVAGFATPNPLPHQLRGGALAALQLERAQQLKQRQETERKRAREEEEVNKHQKQQEQQADSATPMDVDPKDSPMNPRRRRTEQQQQPSRRAPATKKPVEAVSMNLSDSSSDED